MTMEEFEIDVMGLRCPIPVHRARKAIRETPEGSKITIVGDDPESLHDIPALLKRLGLEPPKITEIEAGWEFVIST
tara:strand:- start:121 stop:348 length:228 start_codon:yes stop_codon:yes gene_type:complete